MFRAFKHRNYRLFFIGQGTSLIGTWMQQVAMSWLVFRLTHSAFMLGAVGFAAQIPTFFLSPFGGVWADRVNRRRFLLIAQSLLMLQAAALAVLSLTGTIAVWQILVLGSFAGIINAFEIPTRQTFLLEMVGDKTDLGNAIALNSSLVNGTRLIGPSLAGFIIAFAGEGVCFLVNALSFLAVIVALWRMQVAPSPPRTEHAHILKGLMEGVRYVLGFFPIAAILLNLSVASLTGMSYGVLLPVFATVIFKGGPQTLGLLIAAGGTGAMLGAIFLASRKTIVGLWRLIAISTGVFGAALAAFSFSQNIWLSLTLLVITGFGIMVTMASSNTILQTISDDDKRGRVISFYVMAFMGMAPIGSLLAGALAEHVGAPHTVLIGGSTCLVGALLFALSLPRTGRLVRPIYTKMGLLPEMTIGLQEAAEPASVNLEEEISR